MYTSAFVIIFVRSAFLMLSYFIFLCYRTIVTIFAITATKKPILNIEKIMVNNFDQVVVGTRTPQPMVEIVES